MVEISYLREEERVICLPKEVQEVIHGILQMLDTEYGEDRDKYADDGGYIIVVEKLEDFNEMKKNIYIDCDEVIAEYVDKIVCSDGSIYTNSLILCNNDYGISVIMPLEITPDNLKEYIVE